MANIPHSTLTTTDLHEPKGVSTAVADTVYVADGLGSGAWKNRKAEFSSWLSFDKTTPAYSHAVTTADTVINPTLTEGFKSDFTSTSTPNARVTYAGTPQIQSTLHFTCSTKQASGSNKDLEYVVLLNGTAQENSRVIRTSSTGEWGSVTLFWTGPLSTNDYLELGIKGSAATTLDFASSFLEVDGVAQ